MAANFTLEIFIEDKVEEFLRVFREGSDQDVEKLLTPFRYDAYLPMIESKEPGDLEQLYAKVLKGEYEGVFKDIQIFVLALIRLNPEERERVRLVIDNQLARYRGYADYNEWQSTSHELARDFVRFAQEVNQQTLMRFTNKHRALFNITTYFNSDDINKVIEHYADLFMKLSADNLAKLRASLEEFAEA